MLSFSPSFSDEPYMHYLKQEEIKEILKKAVEFGGEVQRPLIFSRESYAISNLQIENNHLHIHLDEELLPHEDARHIYINLNYRKMNFILKVSEIEVDGNIIKSRIPSVAKAIEERPTSRYKLDFEKYPTVISRTERRGGNHEHQTYVDDISETGLSLIVSDTDEDELKANDHLWIKSIGDNKQDSPLFAKVVYTREVEIQGKVYLKAGVKLEKSFSEELFNHIVQSSIKVLAA